MKQKYSDKLREHFSQMKPQCCPLSQDDKSYLDSQANRQRTKICLDITKNKRFQTYKWPGQHNKTETMIKHYSDTAKKTT